MPQYMHVSLLLTLQRRKKGLFEVYIPSSFVEALNIPNCRYCPYKIINEKEQLNNYMCSALCCNKLHYFDIEYVFIITCTYYYNEATRY